MNLMINLTEKTIGLFSKKTKGKILQESLLLFNEQTFKQTTTANIAKSSDVLEGSLWYHADHVKPLWRFDYNKITQIDSHIFYANYDG